MSNQQAKRIAELEQLAAEEGIALPWPAAVIAQIEAGGGYVDLNTGIVGRSDERVSLTVVGEAVAVASKKRWW